MTTKFQIREAGLEDLEDVTKINLLAFDAIPLWNLMFRDVNPTDMREFMWRFHEFRLSQGCYKIFVIVDVETEYVLTSGMPFATR